jgi:hypothetical protein
MTFLDYEKAKVEDYFLALKELKEKIAVLIEDNYARIRNEKTQEWIIQCAMLNLRISRSDFMQAYRFWAKNLGKRKEPKEKGGLE